MPVITSARVRQDLEWLRDNVRELHEPITMFLEQDRKGNAIAAIAKGSDVAKLLRDSAMEFGDASRAVFGEYGSGNGMARGFGAYGNGLRSLAARIESGIRSYSEEMGLPGPRS